MKVKAPDSLSSSTAENINGMPNPREYVSNNVAPFKAPPALEASISAEPRKAPTQGVKLME